MPSPIAHSVAGLAIWHLTGSRFLRGTYHIPRIIQLGLVVFLANLPDLDFVPQLITGERYHHGASHSIFIALLFSAVLGLAIWRITGSDWKLSFAAIFAVYGAHILLDSVGGGVGVKLWWPLASNYVRAPFMLFPPVHYSRGLIDPSHLVFLTFEVGFAILVFLGLRAWQGKGQPNGGTDQLETESVTKQS